MTEETKDDRFTPVYPLYLTNLDRVLTVVVGGGKIGERKIRGLLAGGAVVRLISPQVTPQLQQWATEGQVEWYARPYQPGDLADAFLVVAATDQRAVNAQIAAEARERAILCNVVDRAEEGNAHTPATLRIADDGGEGTSVNMVFAIGSTGKAPRRVKVWCDALRTWLQHLDRP